ncbi:MAG TPA: c-type cytochrome [Burkholderiales bacterium]|nr:c-type cytochrome [Burkholderiales bacterium]
MQGKLRWAPRLALGLLFFAAIAQAGVGTGNRSGEEVVNTVCAACHATGKNGAPKIGDTAAWAPRAKLGLSSLTTHALNGIRQMPAHGGNPEVADIEIARAITYMVNQSGGNWVEPIDASHPLSERSGEQIVRERCVNCHGAGDNGAPKVGDIGDWKPHLKNGVDYLVHSAVHGHGGMPPRGGMADLTDAEVRNAIIYMVTPKNAPSR